MQGPKDAKVNMVFMVLSVIIIKNMIKKGK